ncbi:MAG: DUF4381 domain-containing protein [Oceanococcus sp.]
MNPPTDPLADLKPIHLPVEPNWFPPAPGWWLLAIALLLSVAAIRYAWQRRQQRRAPLKQALLELEHIQSQHQGLDLLQALNQLLRRAARQSHGTAAASLGVAAWADFLTLHAPTELQQEPHSWQKIAEAAYQNDAPERCGEYVAYSRAWLQRNLPC